MKVNTSYYTNISTDDTAGTKFAEINACPVNTQFDISAAYAMQGGEFAPFCTMGIIRGGTLLPVGSLDPTAEIPLQKYNKDYTSNFPAPLFMVTKSDHAVTNGYQNRFGDPLTIPETWAKNQSYDVSSRAKNYNYSNVYHWAPYATGLTANDTPLYTYYDGAKMICGFSYRDVVGSIHIRAYANTPDLARNETSFSGSSYAGELSGWNPAAYPHVTAIYVDWFAATTAGVQPSGSQNNRIWNPSFRHNNTNYVAGIASPVSTNFQKIEFSRTALKIGVDDVTQNYSPAYNLMGLYSQTNLSLNETGYVVESSAPYGRGTLVPLFRFLKNNYATGEGLNKNRTHYWWDFSKTDILHIVATWGLYFAEDDETAKKAVTGINATDEKLYIAVADSDGVYRGRYLQGEDIKNAPNADWGGDDPFDWWDDNGVSPGGSPGEDTDKTPLSKPNITAFGSFNKAYAMTQSTLNDLQNYLWNINDTTFDEIVEGLKLMGENPLNAIIDCRMYPFDILSYIGNTGAQLITLGRRQSTVSGVHLGNVTNCVLDLGSVYWARYTNTFLDYAPYSSGELYVPYVGRFSLDPNVYVGKTVSVYLIVDFMTGGCECIVYGDGIAYDYKSGQIGVDIPISGVNAAQWAAQIVGLTSSAANNVMTGAGSIATGNAFGTVSSAANLVNSAVQLSSAMTPTLQQATSGTSSTGQWLPQTAYLTVHVPIPKQSNSYGSTVGYACQISGQIGGQSGYTVCSNVQLDSTFATQSERDEIVKLLCTGVYV